jgi:hypothetical protein
VEHGGHQPHVVVVQGLLEEQGCPHEVSRHLPLPSWSLPLLVLQLVQLNAVAFLDEGLIDFVRLQRVVVCLPTHVIPQLLYLKGVVSLVQGCLRFVKVVAAPEEVEVVVVEELEEVVEEVVAPEEEVEVEEVEEVEEVVAPEEVAAPAEVAPEVAWDVLAYDEVLVVEVKEAHPHPLKHHHLPHHHYQRDPHPYLRCRSRHHPTLSPSASSAPPLMQRCFLCLTGMTSGNDGDLLE